MTGVSRLHGRGSDRSLEKRLALPAYVEELAARPWAWGQCDCTMAVATWIERIYGVDPLRQYRGSYDSPLSAKRAAKRAGGFLPALGALLDEAGLERTQAFETGDVAAVNAALHERSVMPVVGCILAIRFGNFWVCKAYRGIVARDFAVITGWRL
jgi:hypothetical protein